MDAEVFVGCYWWKLLIMKIIVENDGGIRAGKS